MRVPAELVEGISLERMLERMDAAGIERAMLVAAKVGNRHRPSCYHVPYELVRDAVRRYPDRFYGLAGLDPTDGMQGVSNLERAVK
jgi:predicted TIM-barrel fold metal-dependent hydrolase